MRDEAPKLRMLHLSEPEDVCEMLSSDGSAVHLLNGGLSRPRLLKPLWLDLRRIPALVKVDTDEAGWLRIGSALTVQDLADNETLRRRGRLLALACERLGRLQWRRRAGLGGVVLRAAPGCGLGSALECLDAVAVFLRQAGARREPLRAGMLPPLAEGELLESVRLPLRKGRQLSVFHGVADCSLALQARRHRDGRLSAVRMAMEGGDPGRLSDLARRAEDLLRGGALDRPRVLELGRLIRGAWLNVEAAAVRTVVGRLQGSLLRHAEHMDGLRKRQRVRARRRKR